MTNKKNLTSKSLTEEKELLYHVIFDENCEVEGRYFKKGETYPVLKKDDKYVILRAENGDFAFRNELMERAIKEWNLQKVSIIV